MSVITKKDEKIEAVARGLAPAFTDDDFVAKFIEMYPADWQKVEAAFRKHERATKPGKTHPMPAPRQYVLNASHQVRKRLRAGLPVRACEPAGPAAAEEAPSGEPAP